MSLQLPCMGEGGGVCVLFCACRHPFLRVSNVGKEQYLVMLIGSSNQINHKNVLNPQYFLCHLQLVYLISWNVTVLIFCQQTDNNRSSEIWVKKRSKILGEKSAQCGPEEPIPYPFSIELLRCNCRPHTYDFDPNDLEGNGKKKAREVVSAANWHSLWKVCLLPYLEAGLFSCNRCWQPLFATKQVLCREDPSLLWGIFISVQFTARSSWPNARTVMGRKLFSIRAHFLDPGGGVHSFLKRKKKILPCQSSRRHPCPICQWDQMLLLPPSSSS